MTIREVRRSLTGQHARPPLLQRCGRVLIDLAILSRPFAAICAGAELLVGSHLTRQAVRPAVGDGAQFREAMAISLVTAAINVVNDIRDVRADAISQPSRPLPAGRLSALAACLLACVQGLAALVLSVGVPAGIIVTVVLLSIGIGYSFTLKGTVLLGNLVVALLAASPVVYGARLGGIGPRPALVAAGIVFTFMFAFEVLKTIRDVGADGAVGYRTVATQWGTRAAASVFRLALVTYVAAAAAPVIVDGVSPYYVVLMGLGTAVPSLIVGWGFPVGSSSLAVRPVLRVMTISWIPGMIALAMAARA
jgi:4-hydroxybenzoate polyprenyltransferase